MIYTYMDSDIISVTMKNYEKVISGTMKNYEKVIFRLSGIWMGGLNKVDENICVQQQD